MPNFQMLFIKSKQNESGISLDRKIFPFRKIVERELDVYFASLSARTLVYKGMLTTGQLETFFPDLTNQNVKSKIALVHARFSTNTFPSWPLAHPYRLIAHNGEINTVKGNRNWMQARESGLASEFIPGEIERCFPIVAPAMSDSASFDEVLELLHLGGRSLPHAVLMMIPEAWENNPEMDIDRKAFYEFHSTFMEPWDGPACVTFTDGDLAGAVLDRNGLRPGRFWITDDGIVVLASESGVLPDLDSKVIRKGRLQPGKMFLVDTVAGKVIEDEEIKSELAQAEPYQEWVNSGLIHLENLPEREHIEHTRASVVRRQQTFGYTEEELRIIISPMAQSGLEAIGSMGSDTPIAALSEKPRLLFDYFTQLFAQVTNPPLDAIREEIVTSLSSAIGPEGNLLQPAAGHAHQVVLPFPVIDNDELAKLLHINKDGKHSQFAATKISGLYYVNGKGEALEKRLLEIFDEVDRHIAAGKTLLILSDRDSDMDHAPIPSLLLTSAVHHHLIRTKKRTKIGLLVEAGDVREVHHVALLIGYGAAAVNPYLAMETAEILAKQGRLVTVSPEKAVKNLVKALGKGVLKVMSKMGVSTVASYRGAQIFEAIGLSQVVVDKYFTGTVSRLGGIDIETIAKEVSDRHDVAYPPSGIQVAHRELSIGGEYQYRREGEPHLFNPETVFKLQHATRTDQVEIFREYSSKVDNQAKQLMTIRGLLELKTGVRPAIDIDQVEPIEEIVKRFSTGAMSYGSISQEAHETLAIAMNRLGARSNTGEGGEDPERYQRTVGQDSKRSAIKQVASGRFGVTSEYLVNSDDIQIKMAQGAKPGEGGQLPGHKVYPWIAKTRYSTPGVGLISPPPHHDIYSIEDLAQLIHDLKNANNQARIHVKLVAEVGVGTVAAGVSKAHADVVLISGHDGGTGASPLTSLKHAGAPWELGLAETQQTLLLNGLRDRIVVQADGQMKTGRDVIIAALLGAEEFGFATAPLVVMGCIMMRVCHLDTCPVGVATQNPLLRERFTGQADHVVNFFKFIAQEVREYLAQLGFKTLDEAIGQVEFLESAKAVAHYKAQGLDLTPILQVPETTWGERRCTKQQDHGLEKALDNELIKVCQPALENKEAVRAQFSIYNSNRTVGTMLGSEITRQYPKGLASGTIDLTFTGSAGQSFGAFIPKGLTLRLEGDANDYLGKGLSGGSIVVRPNRDAKFIAEENVIAGNVIGYGATDGEIFIRGIVGERFCVRNSGALAVVEGVGDHACEYMTGGRVIVLGKTGRNFAAGMSGGIAYVLDLENIKVNLEMVHIQELGEADLEFVKTQLKRFQEETNSKVASDLIALSDDEIKSRISKVMPKDYQRVLNAQKAAEISGEDPIKAIMEASRG
jgi:glutamate synthase (NADPH/NADH) large chain